MSEVAELVSRMRSISLDLGLPSMTHLDSAVIRHCADILEAMAREGERLMSDNRDLVQHCVGWREAAQMWQARALSAESRLVALAVVDSKKP